MSTLPALLAEYGIAETLWARHIASSLHRSLRRTIARTDVLGRCAQFWCVKARVPKMILLLLNRRFGILSQLLEAFASKTLRDPCRLQQFVKHDCRVPIKQQFCFRQHASVQEIVDESYAIYYDARCAFEMTGKSNDNLQRTPDHQHFAATLASLAVGVMFTCPISGRTLFGDDTGQDFRETSRCHQTWPRFLLCFPRLHADCPAWKSSRRFSTADGRVHTID